MIFKNYFFKEYTNQITEIKIRLYIYKIKYNPVYRFLNFESENVYFEYMNT